MIPKIAVIQVEAEEMPLEPSPTLVDAAVAVLSELQDSAYVPVLSSVERDRAVRVIARKLFVCLRPLCGDPCDHDGARGAPKERCAPCVGRGSLMPAPRQYPTPAEQAFALLSDAKAAGLPFEEAWRLVVGEPDGSGRGCRVRWPHATPERRGWKEALEATRDEWRAAYERQPSALSVALERRSRARADDDDRSEPASRAGAGRVRLGFVVPVEGISRRAPAGMEDFDHEAIHASFFGGRRAR